MKLIDKDAAVAEIKNQINRCNIKKRSYPVNTMVEAICDSRIHAYKELLSFLDTLEVEEVEEVDLVKEISNWWDKHYDHNGKYKFWKYSGHYIENSTIITLAKHFYELGLKAQIPISITDMELKWMEAMRKDGTLAEMLYRKLMELPRKE